MTLRLQTGLILAAFALAACQRDATPAADTAAPADATPAADAWTFQDAIAPGDFAHHVEILSSDAFEGRGPGTAGEDKTVEYIKAQMQRIGLQPGMDGQWFQTVPMVETTATDGTTLDIDVGGKQQVLKAGDDMVIGTRSGKTEVKIDASQLVFVGYGVDAPEQQWNDYAGLDAKGKTVVMLVNDPGFHAGDDALFEGKRMTYYGRWTYKFEEAARQGAAAAIIIHDDAGAGYGWDVVKNSWSGAQFDLAPADEPGPRLPVQGWITGAVADMLFARAGLDGAALRRAAGKQGFRAVPIGDARLDAKLQASIRQSSSRNVVARLRGSKFPDEAIVYTAHWDHLGTHAEESGDAIYNGAIDNGTGIAGVLEIAEQFTVQSPKPERSIVFLFVTLEESGLLGSAYYAANPVVPLAKTVAVVNIDALPVVGPTRDLIVVGLGNSELEDVLEPIADKQQRTLVPESAPEKGLFFRSDHFSFAKAGVPALYAKGGTEHVDKGRDYGLSVLEDYTARRYHKPADHFDAGWDLRGIVQDLEALYQVGKTLSLARSWPNYREGNSFKAARDASRAGAK